jgi:hypothetical protein
MRNRAYFIIFIFFITLLADESDWIDNSWDSETIKEMEEPNDVFKKMEIKNRSKKEYRDKIYKYIEDRDYSVKNSNIEIATVQLSDDIKSSEVEVNVLTENLKVYGNEYKSSSIDIKDNPYRYFVNHDETSLNLFENEEDKTQPKTLIEQTDPLYRKVPKSDVSELEVIDLRDNDEVKEINIYIKDTTIRVGGNYEDKE